MDEKPKFDCLAFKKRAFKMKDAEFYRSYDDIFRETGFFDYTASNFELFERWVPTGDSVLDVGCGGGETLLRLAPRCLPNRMCGIDISQVALDAARKILPLAVALRLVDIEKGSDFRGKSWDTIICGHTFEHLRNPHAAAKEIRRVALRQVIVLIPLQGKADRWKPTNLHIQFWPTVKAFESFWGNKAAESIVAREETLAVLRFKMEDRR